MWKDFFYFSRRERQGILVLIALIAGVFLGKFLFTPKESESPKAELEPKKNNEKQEVVQVKAEDSKEQTPYVIYNQKQNYASTKSYRQDEKRTYYSSPTESRPAPKQNRFPATEKFAAGTVIEINESDTLQLMKIPGIGAGFAKRIVNYRNLLGGFYRLEQLREVYGMYVELYEKMVPYLRIDANKITPIQVNTASLDKLKSHPYINFYQAKAIVEMRRKKGKLENINELSFLEEFSPEDMERIKRYLAF